MAAKGNKSSYINEDTAKPATRCDKNRKNTEVRTRTRTRTRTRSMAGCAVFLLGILLGAFVSFQPSWTGTAGSIETMTAAEIKLETGIETGIETGTGTGDRIEPQAITCAGRRNKPAQDLTDRNIPAILSRAPADMPGFPDIHELVRSVPSPNSIEHILYAGIPAPETAMG